MPGRKKQQLSFLTTVMDKIGQENKFLHLLPDGNFLKGTALTPDILIDELYNQILTLRTEVIDKYNNINSKFLFFDDEKLVWIRIINSQKNGENDSQKNNAAAYNYLRIFYAYLIAAVTLAQIYKFDTRDYLNNIEYIRRITTEV